MRSRQPELSPFRHMMSIFWLTLLASPFSPSIYFLIIHGNRCFEAPAPLAAADSPAECLLGITVFAPVFAVFGGLAHDDGPDDNPWPGILLTSLIVGIMLTAIRARFFRPRSAAE